MENVTRTIVDIRVHTAGMTRAEVLDFARQEARARTADSATVFPSQFRTSDSSTSRIDTGRRSMANPDFARAGSE